MAGLIKHNSDTDVFKGQLFLFVGDSPIAYGKDATLNVATEEIDISNKMMGSGWKGAAPGKKSFAITSESLYTQAKDQVSFDTLLDKQSDDEIFDFFLGTAKVTNGTATGGEFTLDKTKPYRTGKVMISSLDLKSTDGDIATCSASLTGVGALGKGTPTT